MVIGYNTHCACAHDMSIRPIQVQVTMQFLKYLQLDDLNVTSILIHISGVAKGVWGLKPHWLFGKFFYVGLHCKKVNNHLMNNHLNMLPKQAKFDLKCSKMRWRLGSAPDPAG